VLAIFLLYTSIAGGGTPALTPSQLAGHTGRISLTGKVVGPVTGDSHGSGLRFRLHDILPVKGATDVAVVYKGDMPDQFKVGADIILDGKLVDGSFIGVPGSMLTKCPSRYTAKPQGQ
jgi:cytochrome c-type biogenesis protein CcmE